MKCPICDIEQKDEASYHKKIYFKTLLLNNSLIKRVAIQVNKF